MLVKAFFGEAIINPCCEFILALKEVRYCPIHHPDALKNEEAVKRSVRNIVLTNFGEKKFQPFFGGDVISQLFENITPFTAFEMEKAITRTILNNEPRVEALSVKANTNNDQNSVDVTVRFTIKNSQQPVILSFTLERIR